MEQERLFSLPDDELHAHVVWKAQEGWSLWVNSWEQGEGPRSGSSEGYDRLALNELLSVLEEEARRRTGLRA
jgi:hypothetical protein